VAFVTNDPQKIYRTTGFDPWAHCLPPRLAIDGARSAIPLMATEGDATPWIFLKEIDRANVEALDIRDARLAWYSPYFTFGGLRAESDAWPDLQSAVRGLIQGSVEMDPDMPVGLYQSLAEAPDAADPSPRALSLSNHYVIPRGEVESSFEIGRGALREAAAPYIERLDAGALRPWLDRRPGDRFESLDRLLESAGLQGIVASSALSVQELTGIPLAWLRPPFVSVYLRGSDEIHFFSGQEIPMHGLPVSTPAGSDSILGLVRGGSIGYEEVDLSWTAWTWLGLRDSGRPATDVLRRWRELRAWEDVSAYVIGSAITLTAIDDALRSVHRALNEGSDVTELDAYQVYRSTVERQISHNRLPVRVRTYFTHTHAGNRSHFPAKATQHSLVPLTSLKIDGGLEIYDTRGMFHAVSDVTRSAVGTSEGETFYRSLTHALLHGAIAACRPGTKGEDVFIAGLAVLEREQADIISGGFVPDRGRPLSQAFQRNIGHLLGKQEPATIEFQPWSRSALEAGMVGAAEFQWPYQQYCIGVEDLFLVTDDRPVNLTRKT
jgi:Xaa-Pro aminopeptidase